MSPALRAAIKLIAHTASHRDTRGSIIKWALFIKTLSVYSNVEKNIFQLASQFIFISPLFIYSGRESVFVYYCAVCSQPRHLPTHNIYIRFITPCGCKSLARESCMNANLLAPQVQSYVKKLVVCCERAHKRLSVFFGQVCVRLEHIINLASTEYER